MAIQVNDNGIVRTLKKIQMNDNGVIRTFQKIQINNNGVIREVFRLYSIDVTYSGAIDIVTKTNTQGYAILKSAGTFSFTKDIPATVDIYLVGRGQDCIGDKNKVQNGGAGGYIRKYTGIALPASFNTIMPESGSWANVEIRSTANALLYSSSGGTYAAAGKSNTLTDFWGRKWAGGGGTSETTGNGGSNGDPGTGTGGGSSPIGGGGAGVNGVGGTPNGAGPGANSYDGGGAGGVYTSDGTGRATAVGGGGRGGTFDGGGGGLGGGGAGWNNQDNTGKTGFAAEGGGGVIIIRWGDSPL